MNKDFLIHHLVPISILNKNIHVGSSYRKEVNPMDNQKPGGGNKPQPYIPAGNGDKSGEYTNKPLTDSKPDIKLNSVRNCFIRNIRFRYNFMHSKLVGKVVETLVSGQGASIPKAGRPNSVVKKIIDGYVVTERYYNNKGEAYLDIDYTCHKNPSAHPYVPHIHRWKSDEHGELQRQQWEKFQ